MSAPRETKRSNALFQRVTHSASWEDTEAVEALLIAAAGAPSLIESLENRVQWARVFLKLEPAPDHELLNAAGRAHNETLGADPDGLAHKLIAAEVILRTLPTLADLRERTYDAGAIDRALRAGMAWAAFVVMAREHVAAFAEPFKDNSGRGPGPLRKLIDKEFTHLSGLKARQAWDYLGDLPAKKRAQIEFYDDHAYLPDHSTVGFRRFANLLSEIRSSRK